MRPWSYTCKVAMDGRINRVAVYLFKRFYIGLRGESNEFSDGIDTKLFHYMPAMHFYGFFGDLKLICDLLVQKSGDDIGKDFFSLGVSRSMRLSASSALVRLALSHTLFSRAPLSLVFPEVGFRNRSGWISLITS